VVVPWFIGTLSPDTAFSSQAKGQPTLYGGHEEGLQ
jgi:hypothetical protein